MSKDDRRIMRCFKLFWAWQEDTEARWLEQLALEGWSLSSVRGIRYTFVKSAPQSVVYRLDYQAVSAEEFEEYRQLCEEMGWECVARLGNWIYLRRPAGQEGTTELYSDNASRLQRYRSQFGTMALALVPLIYMLVVHPLAFGPMRTWWGRALQIVLVPLGLVLLYAMGRISQMMRRLESSPKE